LIINIFFLLNLSAIILYDKLYIVGDATEAGWNPGAALEMTSVETGVFTWTGLLSDNSKDQARFKFIVAREWHPSISCRFNVNGHLMLTSCVESDLYERPISNEGYDNAFQVSSNGTYSIHVDLNTMKLICTKISNDYKPDLNQFTKETFQTTSGEILNYRKLIPLSVTEGTKYPLVICLHGAGERGSDNAAQLKYGGELFVKTSNREAFPAYVLFPQCPTQYFWPFDSNPPSYVATTFPVEYPIAPAIKQVKELIDEYLKKADIDKDRVYVLGLSMGGMGTFDLASRYPEIFATAVPICGGININRINNTMKNIQWRIFHGGSDGIVSVQNSRDANAKLTTIGANVEYIEFPGVDHFAWTPAFAQEDFLSWIFSKTRIVTTGIDGITNKDIAQSVSVSNNRIVIKQDKQTQYWIFNSIGQLKKNGKFHDGTVSISGLNTGIYLVKVQAENVDLLKKIIINN